MKSTPAKLNFGKSLLVPSVQEIAKQHLNKIPARYVRQEKETPVISAGAAVPVIDLQRLISGDFMDFELQKLHSACQQWGFLQVINHGVTPSLLEDFKREVIKLFRLPMEEKKKLWQQEDSFEGFGHAFVESEEQKLDWSDRFGLMILPPHIRNVDLFQKLPSKLRDIMEAYCKEIKSLAIIIISQLAKALRMDEKEIRDLFSDGLLSMRMNCYPPCPEPDRAIGLSPHSDASALTILFQLNETEGLQVRKDDIWVPIKPLPNALIVNIGDMTEKKKRTLFMAASLFTDTIHGGFTVHRHCSWRQHCSPALFIAASLFTGTVHGGFTVHRHCSWRLHCSPTLFMAASLFTGPGRFTIHWAGPVHCSLVLGRVTVHYCGLNPFSC